ncbi:MAG: ABC transporter ATP-binding protein [Chloroflexi bacterium]|jgi:branched-chain amino acid transport system ATP-binding protein|nr:ABC transporter ATP-binding protein [Chloroflexota bacterium]
MRDASVSEAGVPQTDTSSATLVTDARASATDQGHILELDDIHTYYGNIHALKGISMYVDRGEIVTLIGSNGAGKSTTLRTISGSLQPRHGTVSLEGRRIDELAAHEVVRLGIAQAPEGRRVFSRMTVYENLELGAYTRKGSIVDDVTRVFDLFPRLKERRTQKAGTMSGGEQQMLAIGRALMAHPTVLLLDEPSMGLSPILTEQIFSIIGDINAQGTTVLLVEQNALMALNLAQRGYVLQTGRIILADTAANLASNEQVRQAYLGEI